MSLQKKPTVLLTNDDGINAPGLRHLWHALKDSCDLYIFAPSSERSGAALSLTLHSPLQATSVQWEENTPAWKVDGTPADCVRMATRMILKKQPDIILSGINKGANSGRNILYSGTVGGIIEGAMRGIPGIAFSCVDPALPNYASFEANIFSVVEYLLINPLSKGSFLNVNFPSKYQSSHKGMRFARQGKSFYIEDPKECKHPAGWPYYWMGCLWEDHDEHEESDVHLLNEGYITVVPIHVQDLTDQAAFEARKEHLQNLFPV